MFGKLKAFIDDVVKEMKKVSWPTRVQLKESTNVVIATSLLITAFIYIVDLIMNTLIKMYY